MENLGSHWTDFHETRYVIFEPFSLLAITVSQWG
jgi:hypothetical protein